MNRGFSTVGPILFMRNENIAHVMPRVTTRAVTSCVHHAVRAHRQANHPNYMWCARNYLWTCIRAGQMIFIKYNCLTF